jgi:tetratricopeptide (TPR) repeat protein
LGQPLSAAPAYKRALELDPKSASAHYKFGELAYTQREYAAAAESLERALALDPAGALIDRGRAREMANKAAAKARGAR